MAIRWPFDLNGKRKVTASLVGDEGTGSSPESVAIAISARSLAPKRRSPSSSNCLRPRVFLRGRRELGQRRDSELPPPPRERAAFSAENARIPAGKNLAGVFLDSCCAGTLDRLWWVQGRPRSCLRQGIQIDRRLSVYLSICLPVSVRLSILFVCLIFFFCPCFPSLFVFLIIPADVVHGCEDGKQGEGIEEREPQLVIGRCGGACLEAFASALRRRG